jgi:hypothetical protein
MELSSPLFEGLATLNEVGFSLYPALVKSVPTTLNTQVFARHFVFVLISLFITPSNLLVEVFSPTLNNAFHYLLMGGISTGILQLSYFGFEELPLDLSMPIYYSYPWIIIGFAIFAFERTQPLKFLPYLIVAYIVMIMAFKPNMEKIKKITELPETKRNTKYLAIASLFGATFLVGVMFILYQSGFETVGTGSIRNHLGGLLLMTGYFIYNKISPDLDWAVWSKLLFFNGVIGYLSFLFRVNSMKFVPEIYYGIFVFIGTVIAYYIAKQYPHLQRKESKDFS